MLFVHFVCVSVQVKDWVKKRLDKFTPLTNQPEDVKADLEKLQQEVKHTHTHAQLVLEKKTTIISSKS